MKAQMARGVDFANGPVKERVKAIVPLLVPLFVSAFKRAEELATAMEARGYRGGDQSRYKSEGDGHHESEFMDGKLQFFKRTEQMLQTIGHFDWSRRQC